MAERAGNERCRMVTDYDDSIGGEGEIVCGARMLVSGEAAVCDNDHRWIRCHCGKSNCTGWRTARWEGGTWA